MFSVKKEVKLEYDYQFVHTFHFTFLEQNQQRYEYTRLILTSLIIFDFVEVLMVFEGNMCIHIFYIMKQKIICKCLQSHSDYLVQDHKCKDSGSI